MGGLGEAILIISLLFGGGYATRWWNEEPRMAKTINLQIPENLKGEYLLPNCYETKDEGESCEKIIPRPRYFVSEKALYNFTVHSKKKTLYLNISQDMTDAYNKDKYIED